MKYNVFMKRQIKLLKELHFFEKHRSEYLKHHEGQFVLIKGNEFVGAYTTEEEAYKAGVDRFGNSPFLIKKVTRDEPINAIPALTLGLMRHANS